jgi:hypothetical protein
MPIAIGISMTAIIGPCNKCIWYNSLDQGFDSLLEPTLCFTFTIETGVFKIYIFKPIKNPSKFYSDFLFRLDSNVI